MTNIELSLFIEANYPLNKKSMAKRKQIFGIGTNDAHYITKPTVDGVRLLDPAYIAWAGMLKRAYDPKYHAICPTYVGVTVCKEWHSFSAFRAWWLANYREGWQLDKDLLAVGNKEYGPDACVYITSRLNAFTTDHGSSRGEFPIGVSIHNKTGKYQSRCRNPITGKKRWLGLFTTPEAAHDAWLNYKLALADQLKPEMDTIDQRIHPNVASIIKAAI